MRVPVIRLLAFLAISGGCAAVPSPAPVAPEPVGLSTHPDSAQYARMSARGSNTIAGQAFLMTRGGEVRLGAGRPVTLDPLTDYSMEWYRRFGARLDQFADVPPDSVFLRARRSATVDAQGKFKFPNLPDGSYLLRSIVRWEVAGDVQGGMVADTITVRGGEEREIILNNVVNAIVPMPIPILASTQLATRRYMSVGTAEGRSCKTGTLSPAPSEDNARSDLSLKAGTLRADAIVDVVCEKEGVSLRHNCMSSIVCRGRMINWM